MSSDLSPRHSVTVRAMDENDISYVSRLHREHLPGGFFRDLGEAFLRRYYLSFLTSPASVALIGEVNGENAGFLVGTVDHATYTRHVGRHHRTRLLTTGAWALVRRPGLAMRLVSTRLILYMSTLRRARHRPIEHARHARYGVLSDLAVDADIRWAGVGRALVEAYVGIAQLHNTQHLQLVALSRSQAAQSFYPNLGWEPGDEYPDADGLLWTPFSREV
jgi:ribosomal protein S18 acetylase RimI-like enzyme